MKTKYPFLLLLLLPALLRSQNAGAFDPARQPVAHSSAKGIALEVSQDLLFASLHATTPGLTALESLQVQNIESGTYLVFRCRTKGPASVVLYAVQLQQKGEYWFAGQVVQTCAGDPCEKCSFSATGCVCERYYDPNDPLHTGRCNHSVSMRQALAPVSLKE